VVKNDAREFVDRPLSLRALTALHRWDTPA